VLVAVRHCGVCHTDLHLHDGYFDLGGGRQLAMKPPLPMALGHEIQGRIAACGPNVRGLEPGAEVAVYPWIGCGRCAICDEGLEHLCNRARALGIDVDGGYAEYVLVPASRYVIPLGGVDPRIAGPLMCSGLTAFSSLRKLAAARRRGPCLIVGLGGVGMMALRLARALGGEPPWAADIDPGKLAVAAEMGVRVFDLRAESAVRQIKAASDGGLAGLIDYVGSEQTAALATRVMRQGGHIILVGLFGGTLTTPLPLLPMRAMVIEGSYVGSLAEARELIELAGRGAIEPIQLEDVPLERANEALARLRAGSVVGRLLLSPTAADA
jgi:D-arabinose 1-dehydrogenase-like Zn-dependent alcohol dehydrogenase